VSLAIESVAAKFGAAIPDPLVVSELEGRVLYLNQAAVEAFALSPQPPSAELSVAELLPGFPLDGGNGNGASGSIVLEAVRGDGTAFPAHVSHGATAAGDGEVRVAIVHDLTEQLHAEAELRRTRDRLAEAQRLARIGSWEWDIVANEVSWSAELFRIYGLEPGEIEPSYEGFLERVHPDDREAVDARNRKAFADHQPFEDVKQCVRANGTVFLMRTQGEVITDGGGNPIRMLGICEDVTAEVAAERAQAELAAIVESSLDAIVAHTLDGRISSWSPGAAELFGHTAAEAIGADVATLFADRRATEADANVARLDAGEAIEHFETRMRRRDGSLIDVSLGMSPVRDAGGKLVAVSMIARDITERKRFEAQLRRLADHDPLTGLMNRRRFEEELAERVAYVDRHKAEAAAVLILDLDNFKYVNDALGHGAGDALLVSVSRVLARQLRATDVLARLGGDEFAVLLPATDADAAHRVAAKLLEALRDDVIQLEGRPIRVTASIGIVGFDAAVSGAALLAEADRAMYMAKDDGRDRAAFIVPEPPGSDDGARLGWEHRIHQALDKDLFVLHAQPVMDLASGEIAKHELLLRMRNGGDELIPPLAFLGVAERLGLIHAIDRWVVREALRTLGERPELRLGVNISGHSIDDPGVLEEIRDGLRKHLVDPARLFVEITETAAIGNIEVAHNFAAALHELGCSLALDDFGTGFGSFYYLKHLPAEFLKIDGDFVAGPRSRTDELVIEAIVGIAKGLGKRTIAEHVEDEATLEAVRAAGVDFAQGFHIGRPLPLEDA
jgi:diguanylate cyclase (GGDEF)-like protein/PAS domain S-box-containing protein